MKNNCMLYNDLIYIKIESTTTAIARVPQSIINEIIRSKKKYKYINAPIDTVLYRLHNDFHFINNGNPRFYTITKDENYIYYNFKRLEK